jgi:hypothetical protein
VVSYLPEICLLFLTSILPVCDIPSLKPGTKTNFVICYEVFTVADYFSMDPLVNIALGALGDELDSKVGPMQLQYEAPDWLDELFEAITLVYQDVPLGGKPPPASPISRLFLSFVHAARFYLLQDPAFSEFLDRAPAFALDVFRSMRATGDFIAHLPDPQCSLCRNKPARTERGFYTHLATEKTKLIGACGTCAVKRDLASPMENWMGKRMGSAMDR